MAAFLNESEVAVVQWCIDYMAGNVEKPLDEKVIHELSKLTTAIGGNQAEVKDGLLNRPFSTLLLAFLAANEIAAT